MKKKTFITLGIIGLAGYYLFRQSRRVDVGNAGVSKLKIEGNGIRINIKLPIINRSDIPVDVTGFLGYVMYGTNQLGIVRQIAPTEIKARAISEPEFTATIEYGSIGTEVYEWLTANIPFFGGTTPPGGTKVSEIIKWEDFRIVGTLYIDLLGIDINQPLFA